MLHELSTFSGYGGFSLGLKLAGVPVRTVGYVENEKYCQEIIKARIRDGCLDDGPIFPDIRSFNGRQYRGLVDIVTAGFPCQPHSSAGQRKGASDPRNLWPDTLRVIGEVGPSYALLENVPGIVWNGYAGTVVGSLSEIGYDCTWGFVAAASVGAFHLRWRWWCLAYPSSGRRSKRGPVTQQEREHEALGRLQQPWSDGDSRSLAKAVPNTEGDRLEGFTNDVETGRWPDAGRGRWWATEPPLDRVANGVADRVGQLSALGNGVVPAVVSQFLRKVG